MPVENEERKTAAELLAEWRAAGRDVVAARAGARVAELALVAAVEAEKAADEVEQAAQAALQAVDRARAAAARATAAASEAAVAAHSTLDTARGDKLRANHDVGVAVEAERDAEESFHDAEREGFPKK